MFYTLVGLKDTRQEDIPQKDFPSSVTMIRFFNRRSRKKSRDFKYNNSSKTSLQNQFTNIHEQDIIGASDGTIPIRRHAYETGADYGTYSSVNSGFVVGNRPRYSSINALGSKESGQDSPPEIVQYLRPPQNYSSPVRDSNAQMKDIPLTLPSPNRPPRSKDKKTNTNINTTDNNNQSSINSVQQQSNNLQMATSRTSPFASDTSSPSFHSPSSIPTSSRHHFPSLKPIHMSPSGTEQSKLNKHIDSYKLQQGKAAADSPVDLPSVYGMNTRRKLLGVNQKQPSAGSFPSNSENPESRINPNNSLPVTTGGEIPHRSLPKPPEVPSCINGPYVATSRGGNSSGPASYVPRHTKITAHEINDYAHLRQRVLVGQCKKSFKTSCVYFSS